jgi:hypothetical protein
MKKLQNNFTTLEQSKRLLELGVPADSADCYFDDYDEGVYVLDKTEDTNNFFTSYPECTPCWSACQLMEIYDICRCYDGDWNEVYEKETYIETYVSAIEEAVLDDMMDFSKLED